MTGEVQAAAHSHSRWWGILPIITKVGKANIPKSGFLEIIEKFGLVK
jgi:hypothetical protein